MNDERGMMNDNGNRDLRLRTRAFALRIIRLYASLPKTVEAQVIGKADELVAVLVSSARTAKKRSKNSSFIVHHSSL
jgi:hypothetical protein